MLGDFMPVIIEVDLLLLTGLFIILIGYGASEVNLDGSVSPF